MAKVTTAADSALEVLLSQPTAFVAAAVRSGASAVGSVALTVDVASRLAEELEQATGTREWALEHLRDTRPLGEVLEIARLIRAQRLDATGRPVVSRVVPAATQRPRPQPHAHVRGRGVPGLT